MSNYRMDESRDIDDVEYVDDNETYTNDKMQQKLSIYFVSNHLPFKGVIYLYCTVTSRQTCLIYKRILKNMVYMCSRFVVHNETYVCLLVSM